MGLGMSHDCWHGAYSVFTRFRTTLAVAAGYKLDADERYIALDWDKIPEGSLEGEWQKLPADPLIILLAHSDCDGLIHPREAGALANRLEELLPLLPKEDDTGHIGNWKETTEDFINGLRLAAENNEDVEFG